MPFVRIKVIKGIEYRYLVESYRDEDSKVRQRVLAYLGQHRTVKEACAFWQKQLKTATGPDRKHAREMVNKLKQHLS